MNLAATAPKKYHRLVRTYYQARAIAFAALFVAIGMHLWGKGHGELMWTLLALQFLVYPHLVFWRARRAENSLKAEFGNLMLDSLLVGAWSSALEFPTWIAFTLFLGTTLGNAINRGMRGTLGAVVAYGAGAAAWAAAAGFRISPETDLAVTALCLAGLSVYIVGLGNIVFAQNQKLRATREALREGEERYRVITEHAGDFIAMLDAGGRWAYASPSYLRLLPAAALESGGDALASVHAEDRVAMRAALAHAVETGQPQKLTYRLIASDGATREFQGTVSSFTYAGAHKAVLVSIDLTELRQRDRKLAVQARAFENMAEAMMIVAADGTILSINRAFTAMTGYGEDDVVGKPESGFRTALEPPQFYEDMHGALERDGHWCGTSWCRRRNGCIYRERRNASAIKDESGRTAYYIFFLADLAASAPSERVLAR